MKTQIVNGIKLGLLWSTVVTVVGCAALAVNMAYILYKAGLI